jgi:hypothetical protein
MLIIALWKSKCSIIYIHLLAKLQKVGRMLNFLLSLTLSDTLGTNCFNLLGTNCFSLEEN